MVLPRHIGERLTELDPVLIATSLAGDLATTLNCEGAKFHSPKPLLVHRVSFGPTPEEQHYLCGVCWDNLLVLKLLMRENEGPLPWEVRREFGNQLRALMPGEDESL